MTHQLAPEHTGTGTGGQRTAYLVGHGTGMGRTVDLVCEDETDAQMAVASYDGINHPPAGGTAWYEPVPFVPALG